MTNEIAVTNQLSDAIVSSLVLDGDIGKMPERLRVEYYKHRCRVLGLDPGENPFQLIRLNGRLVLYATKTCANALTRVNKLSVEIRSTRIDGDLVIVDARASDPSGRFCDDVGVVDLVVEKQLGKANALMKAITKAKRRAVLALVGLGVLDDSEVDGVRGASRVTMNLETGAIEPEPENVIDVDVDMPSAEHAGLVRDLDGAIKSYAKMLGAKTPATWKAACKAAKVSAASPGDLDTDGARAMLRLVCSRMMDTCTKAYAALDAAAPGDYPREGMIAEFCSITGIDTWPEHPTHQQLADVHARLVEMLAEITDSDPTAENAP